MAEQTTRMTVGERLQTYGSFSPEVIEEVSEVAARQRNQNFSQLLSPYHIEDGPQHIRTAAGHVLEVLDIKSPGGYDTEEVTVAHMPHGAGLSGDKVALGMRLAAVLPGRRIILFGNQSAFSGRAGQLSRQDRRHVRNGNLRPTVEPIVAYLAELGIHRTQYFGASLGFDKSLSSVAISTHYEQQVTRISGFDPATTQRRTLLGLASDFFSSEDSHRQYVNAVDSAAFQEYWAGNNGFRTAQWLSGLCRPANLAVARALCENVFEARARSALFTQPNLFLAVNYGLQSEVGDAQNMARISRRLSEDFPDRTSVRAYNGGHSAFDDIDFAAAVALTDLK